MTISKIVLGAVSLIGAGEIGLFGANEATKKTISDGLGKRKIPKSMDQSISENIWGTMTNKLLSPFEEKISPQSDYFINFEKGIEEFPYSYEELENLCQKVSQETYSTIFKTNQKLMDDVRNFCTIDIKTAFLSFRETLLKTSEEERESDKDSFEKNLSFIKKHDVNKYGVLIKELSEFINEDKETAWKKLADWCDKSYKLSFSNEKDPLLLQVRKYCKKPLSETIE